MTPGDLVSLGEALEHGEAVHQHGYPWRIHKGRPEVGIPKVDDHGVPLRDADQELILDWSEADTSSWVKEGWILR